MAEISKIKLPSGTTYDIKDAVAREMISAGVSFIIAWDGNSAPSASSIPAGVVVSYNGTNTTGSLSAADATVGAFYLVKSSTTPSEDNLDIYDEYVVIKPTETQSTWFWEKIGDTKLNLTDVVTSVELSKSTSDVIGADATFKITQPTISLSTATSAETGSVEVMTGIGSVSASGDEVEALTGLGTPSTAGVLGAAATLKNTQPTINLSTNTATATGRVEVLTKASATKTNVKATASGADTSWDSKDTKTVVTGYASPTDDTFVKSVTPTSKKLKTISITGVDGSTTASKATEGASQTTAKGTGTASSNNADWLKNVSVSNEVLTIGAATMDTQTTTQFEFSDVSVPVTASVTTVATGEVADSDTNGASIITAVATGDTAKAITALGSPTTASVIGEASTFSVTQPTVALAVDATAGSGVISVATDMSSDSTFLGATATGGKAEIDSKDEKTVVTGYASPTSDKVLGSSSTLTATPTTTHIKAAATGANTAWDSKDQKSVLDNATSLTVKKGNQA